MHSSKCICACFTDNHPTGRPHNCRLLVSVAKTKHPPQPTNNTQRKPLCFTQFISSPTAPITLGCEWLILDYLQTLGRKKTTESCCRFPRSRPPAVAGKQPAVDSSLHYSLICQTRSSRLLIQSRWPSRPTVGGISGQQSTERRR